MPKERNYNPVQAQRKADKAKAIKKGKSEVQNRRNEQLARRNPERIQKQIDDLKAVTTNGGKLSRHEEQVLEGLEKELRAVNKARDALGDKAPTFGRAQGGEGRPEPGRFLGKRRRDDENNSTDEDIPDDVRTIPMPRDTPPPFPKDVMDAWYAKRRARRQAEQENERTDQQRREETTDKKHGTPAPTSNAEPKTVYEAKPVVRNLQKEAVAAFVPSVVRTKLDKGKGKGGLVEPEEADQLEAEGYLQAGPQTVGAEQPAQGRPMMAMVEDAEDDDD